MQASRCGCVTGRLGRSRLPVLAVALLLLVVFCLTACGGDPPIAKKAVGWWQEIGTTKAYTMHITSTSPYRYQVEYPRSFKVPFPARRDGEKLLIWGEDYNDIVWTLTYDPKTDRLTAVGSQGTFTLKRITAPGT